MLLIINELDSCHWCLVFSHFKCLLSRVIWSFTSFFSYVSIFHVRFYFEGYFLMWLLFSLPAFVLFPHFLSSDWVKPCLVTILSLEHRYLAIARSCGNTTTSTSAQPFLVTMWLHRLPNRKQPVANLSWSKKVSKQCLTYKHKQIANTLWFNLSNEHKLVCDVLQYNRLPTGCFLAICKYSRSISEFQFSSIFSSRFEIFDHLSQTDYIKRSNYLCSPALLFQWSEV